MSEYIKSILEGYTPKADFAREIHACPRTVDNYRKLPDGLPSLTLAGKVYIPREIGREWIERRLVTPTPPGKRGDPMAKPIVTARG